MILLQAALGAPFAAVFVFLVLFWLDYILVFIHNYFVFELTKEESRKLPLKKSAVILAALAFCYILYRVFSYEGDWMN